MAHYKRLRLTQASGHVLLESRRTVSKSDAAVMRPKKRRITQRLSACQRYLRRKAYTSSEREVWVKTASIKKPTA